MAENKIKLLSDEELAKAITLANNKFVESLEVSDSETAQVWESIMLDFLREQRSRDDQYENQMKESREFEYQRNHDYDELNLNRTADEREWEKFKSSHELEEKKLNFETKKVWFEAGKIFATIIATAGGVYSAWANLKAKKIEYSTKSECWHAICQFEDEGEIVKRQPGQQIKL